MALAARPFARLLLAAALAFGLGLAAFALLKSDGLPASDSSRPSVAGASRAQTSTEAQVRRLQADLRARPGNPGLQGELAAAYMQRARETGDPGFYSRADGLLRTAQASAPRDAAVLATAADLALARHDFRRGLELAQSARRAAPGSLAAYPALVDALVELGRYDAAERTLQQAVDVKPDLGTYARVSYLRELHGDLDGAVEAMRRALAASGPVPENVAYIQSLLGQLELGRGRLAAAGRAFRAARAAVPGYLPAQAGLGALAAQRGDLSEAIERRRRIVERLPLPEHVIALGEAELAAGRTAAARRDLELVRAEQALLAGARVNTDVELAVFEADHGTPQRAVALARRAWAAAPSVRSADALGWALTRAGRAEEGRTWTRRALRLGSVDPLFRHHAGMAALAAGRPGEGRRQLTLALRHGLAAHPWQAAQARRALRGAR